MVFEYLYMLIKACKKIYDFNCRIGVNVLIIVGIKKTEDWSERDRKSEMVCVRERKR